jgi:putative tryptophan/tyrosine transport system substrate-binding protein
MDRRALLYFVLSPLAGPVAAQPSAPTKLPRVGILTPADNDRTPVFAAFRDGLRELGYVDGRSIILDYRFARGDFSAFPDLAADVVKSGVDVIVTDAGIAVARAAASATQTIPIVVATVGDPVAQGLVPSLARPGGNVTGFTVLSPELATKRIDLLRTAFPQAKSVAILFNPSSGNAEILRLTEEVSRALGFSPIQIAADSPIALRTLHPAALGQADVIVVLADGMFWNQRRVILKFIADAGLPALYPEREYVDDGGLIAYGPNVPDNYRRVAGYIDRILKGAKPGDLPFQQPVKFDFIINLKTARALSITLPSDLLARANEVIE